jgi:DNA polymerase-1
MKFPNLTGTKKLVLDTETTGVDWQKDKVVGYALAWGPGPKERDYYPVRHTGGGNLDPDKVEAWVGDLTGDPSRRIVGHNLKFDLHAVQNHGISIQGPVECTMVNASLINENRRAYNLAALSAHLPTPKLDITGYLAEKFRVDPKGAMGHFHKLKGNDAKGREYAATDATSTWLLSEEQQGALDAQDLRTVWNVESRLIRVLFDMERRGVLVDLERLIYVKREIEARLKKAQRALPDGFNVRSTPAIKAHLESLGVDGWPVTEKGNPSFPEAWLSAIPHGVPIITVRKFSNLLNTFVTPLQDRHLDDERRVHTDYNQLRADDYGTVTGRLSSSDPNLQQAPKRDRALAELFRSVFLPEPGHTWWSCDYSQQEFRVFTDYSQSKLLVDGYRSVPPIDIHTNVAAMLHLERERAKRINLGILYGAGAKKMARELGISEGEARLIISQHRQLIPEATIFLRQAEDVARRRGYVRTRLRRRRRFPDARLAHKAGNAIVQGTSADIAKLKLVEVYEMLVAEKAESRVLLTVHDEIDLSVAPGEEHLGKRAVEIMSSFGPDDLITLGVPMVVDVHTGTTWAEATFK